MKQTKVKQNGHQDVKPFPQDRTAEKALLGALFIDPESIYEISPIISPESFYLEANGLIFRTILDLSSRNETVDPITVMAELRRHGHADIGHGQYKAEAYIADLMDRAIPSMNPVGHARVIAEMATRRNIIRAGQQAAMLAWDETKAIQDVTEQAQGIIFQAAKQQTRRGLHHISAGLADYIDDIEARFLNPVEVAGIATGYYDLDRILGGLKAQQLIVVAGRPGMGKTAEMVGMMDQMSVDGNKRGAFFSLEMSAVELQNRLISKRTKINTQNLDRGNLGEHDQERFFREAGKLSQAPIFMTDIPAMKPADIRAEALRQMASTGLDYLMVDYLQLVRVPGANGRYEEVSRAAREMKNLAKELEVPLILAAQLNRSVEGRGDKRPTLSDLRDSGEIEEAADVVIMLYRDDYYKGDESKYPNIGENIIAKQRNGPTGTVDLFWNGQTASYHNLEREALNL